MSLGYSHLTMSKLLLFVSATIVLIFIYGPSFASPLDEVPEGPVEKEQWPNSLPGEDMAISKAPPSTGVLAPVNAHYYSYQQQLTIRYGLAGDFPKINLNDNVMGFQYLFPKFLSPKLEAGADLHDDGVGHIHAGARWIYMERSYFRPSAKVGLDHLVDSKEGLATLTHLDNYYLRTTATLEWVVWNPYSVRFENEFLFSSKKSLLELTLGLSRGW